jgi:hypothetical protein
MFKWNTYPAYRIPIYYYSTRIGWVVTTNLDVLKKDMEENISLVGRGVKYV